MACLTINVAVFAWKAEKSKT